FSISAYTSNGYAVIEPDIVYKVNDPGVRAVACVVPAVKGGVATRVVGVGGGEGGDCDRVGGRGAGGNPRTFVGRLPDGIPGNADRHLPRGSSGRAVDRYDRHVQPGLSQYRREQSGDFREQPGAVL